MVGIGELLRPLHVPFEVCESRTYCKTRAPALVSGKDELYVTVLEFNELVRLVGGLILHEIGSSFFPEIVCTRFSGGTWSKSAECMN